MSSQGDTGLSWVFVDEENRERASELVDRFLSDEGVSDELGFWRWHLQVGGNLAPGVSTQQTRLRYFFFAPWAIYGAKQDWDEENDSAESLVRSARREVLTEELVDALEDGAVRSGIIGREKRSGLNRTPDETYWNGLRQWGFIENADTSPRRSEYFRAVPKDLEEPDESTPEEVEHPSNFWKSGIWGAVRKIENQYDESGELHFELSDTEAEFVRARLEEPTSELENTLVPFLLERALDVREGHVAGSDFEELLESWDYPWDVRGLSIDTWVTAGPLNSYGDLDKRLEAARGFARAAQGAEIRYALECAERAREIDEVEHVTSDDRDSLKETWRVWKATYEKKGVLVLDDREVQRPGTDLLQTCIGEGETKPADEVTARFLDDFAQALGDERNLEDLIAKRETEAKAYGERRLQQEESLAEWSVPNSDGDSDLDDPISPRDFRWGKLKDFARDLAGIDEEDVDAETE